MLLLSAVVSFWADGRTAHGAIAPRFAVAVPPTVPTGTSAARGSSTSTSTMISSSTALPKHLEPQAAARPWTSIVVHHSATPTGDVAGIDAAHKQNKDRDGKPWLGIGYHFVVGNGRPMADGEIQPTFRWTQQLAGAHAGTREYNDQGIGICLIGNFDDAAPTARQLEAVRSLTLALAERYSIPRQRVVRHRDVQATACPGRLFPWDQIQSVLPSDAAPPGRRPTAAAKGS